MIHGMDAVAIGLGGDIAVLDVDLHPLVGGLLGLFLQYFTAQYLAVLRADRGNPFESLIIEQMSKADGAEMSPDMRDPLVGVLKPCTVLCPHRNVAYGRESPAAGPAWKSLRVSASELQVHQPAVSDVVVVRRSEGLDDAGLDPLSATALVPNAQRADDPAHRGLAGVPASGLHSGIHRAFPVGLPLHIEHPARFGRDDSFVTFHPAERPILTKARDRAIDQPGVELRQGRHT